jgi:dTDP-4-amino-4,6-dideoxygalactose transaminase
VDIDSRGSRGVTRPLFVTRPLMPPLEEFLPSIEAIWKSGQVTNGGAFHQAFEAELARYLGVQHVSVVASGTVGLLLALRSLGLQGEVITSPYSFVATSHALLWLGLTPVFADIDPTSFNLDPAAVEAAITPRTCAILAVHTYGQPCDVEGLAAVAMRHGLKLVYDAAHAFGVCDAGGSILRYGNLSVLSFHGTKVFHTFEGGAVISPDAATKKEIDYLRNFGFVDEVTVVEAGMNGKMDELRAAFGLLQLKHVDAAIELRREIDAFYRQRLDRLEGLRCMPSPRVARFNFGYFPVFFETGGRDARDAAYEAMRAAGVMVRRYFHPLISDFPMYAASRGRGHAALPIARRCADSVLCLPIYPGMEDSDCERVVDALKAALA